VATMRRTLVRTISSNLRCKHPGPTMTKLPRLADGTRGPSEISKCSVSLLAAMGLILGSAGLLSADTTSVISVRVTIGEEARIQVWDDSVNLKIRLASGVTARLWLGEVYGLPPATAKMIERSGVFEVSFKDLSPSDGSRVCFQSSDSVLRDSLPVQNLMTISSEVSPGR
jgi:hypothetical protein